MKEEALEQTKTFGIVLREQRKEKNWSQERLSFEADLDRSFLSEIERGVKQPTISTLFRLAHALGMKPSQLMRIVEERTELQH